jgi:glutamate racemase
VRALEKLMPELSLVYFGDVARTPYGSKSAETILRYSRQNTEFLLEQGAKLIIVGCNSAASVAGHRLSEEYNVPVLEVITPAVDRAVASSENGRIGIIGTRATIASGIYEKKIRHRRAGCTVISAPCPLLVPLVEEGWMAKKETKTILKKYLHPLKMQSIDTLVLGCTHYPLLKELIVPRIGKGVQVIDSSIAVASVLQEYLHAHPEFRQNLQIGGLSQYYVSDMTDTVRQVARDIFSRDIDFKIAKVTGQ